MVWEITLRCDHACSHCGSRAELARPDELTTAEMFDVADHSSAWEPVTLIGGEAYLRSDVYDLVNTSVRNICGHPDRWFGLTERRLKFVDAGLKALVCPLTVLRPCMTFSEIEWEAESRYGCHRRGWQLVLW